MRAAKGGDQAGIGAVRLLIALCLMAVVVAAAWPQLQGLFHARELEAFNRDKSAIQRAVEAYHLIRPQHVYPTGSGGAGVIDFTLLVTDVILLRTMPPSAGAAHGGTGSYAWYIDSQGVITTTFIQGTYP